MSGHTNLQYYQFPLTLANVYLQIETFHHKSPDGMEKYVNPKIEDHGHNGYVTTNYSQCRELS